MMLGRARGFVLTALDVSSKRARRKDFMKSQMIGIGFAVTTGCFLFFIRNLLLTLGRNRRIPGRAYLSPRADDEAGPGRGSGFGDCTPETFNSFGSGFRNERAHRATV